jgi:hypothetical protein
MEKDPSEMSNGIRKGDGIDGKQPPSEIGFTETLPPEAAPPKLPAIELPVSKSPFWGRLFWTAVILFFAWSCIDTNEKNHAYFRQAEKDRENWHRERELKQQRELEKLPNKPVLPNKENQDKE